MASVAEDNAGKLAELARPSSLGGDDGDARGRMPPCRPSRRGLLHRRSNAELSQSNSAHPLLRNEYTGNRLRQCGFQCIFKTGTPAMPRSTSTAILSRLPEPLSAHLFAGAKSCHLRAGDALFAAGDSGDGCYRQERGLLKVIRARKREQGLEAIGSGAV
jgi:hypothetical protein